MPFQIDNTTGTCSVAGLFMAIYLCAVIRQKILSSPKLTQILPIESKYVRRNLREAIRIVKRGGPVNLMGIGRAIGMRCTLYVQSGIHSANAMKLISNFIGQGPLEGHFGLSTKEGYLTANGIEYTDETYPAGAIRISPGSGRCHVLRELRAYMSRVDGPKTRQSKEDPTIIERKSKFYTRAPALLGFTVDGSDDIDISLKLLLNPRYSCNRAAKKYIPYRLSVVEYIPKNVTGHVHQVVFYKRGESMVMETYDNSEVSTQNLPSAQSIVTFGKVRLFVYEKLYKRTKI